MSTSVREQLTRIYGDQVEVWSSEKLHRVNIQYTRTVKLEAELEYERYRLQQFIEGNYYA